MTRAMLVGLLASLILTLASGPAPAAEAKSQCFIVLVGISEYADPQINARPHAEDDAKALYDLFTDKRYQVQANENVRLLLGKADEKRKSQPATRDNILQAVRWAVKEARKDDLILFAFFGQGAPNANRVCYFATDSTFKGRDKNSLAAGDFEQELKKLKSHQFCAFLDVDLRGFDSKGEKVEEPVRERLFDEFLGNEEDLHLVGRVLFLSNYGSGTSMNYKGHSLFAHVLLNGLKGAADREGKEADGTVFVDELADYVSKELPPLAKAHGTTKEEHDQHPYVLRASSSNFPLAKNPAVAEKVAKRLEKLAELAAADKISKDVAEEGRKLLGRMPKLKAQRDLRKKYEQLVDGKLAHEDFSRGRIEIMASTKLHRRVAMEYATKVIQATQILKEGYVRDVNQGEMIDQGIRGLYRRLDEEIPQEIRTKLAGVKTMTEEELTNLLADVRLRLGKREDLADHRDLDLTLQRIGRELDPYTTYIDSETLQRFQQETTGRFTGIGIQINQPSPDVLQVITPLKGSPAYRAGIKAGDIITTIIREVDNDGKRLEKPEIISVKGLELNDAVKKIQGKPNTKIKLVVEREGAGSLEFEIARESIEVESVLGYRRNDDDEWNFYVDPEAKICYVRLTSFSRNTARDLQRLMGRLDKRGINGFILDLRFNPGGLLTSAVEISDLFIDDGLIVSIKPRVGRESIYTGVHDGSYLKFPMVCLVNGLSASGSEIVSACLQDHGRAVIMGERSYGKGSVQNIQPFEGGELKMTTASFWRPNGKNLNRTKTAKEADDWGVLPDRRYMMKLDGRERDLLQKHLHDTEIIPRRDVQARETKPEFRDRQLDAAVDYLRAKVPVAVKAAAKKAG